MIVESVKNAELTQSISIASMLLNTGVLAIEDIDKLYVVLWYEWYI